MNLSRSLLAICCATASLLAQHPNEQPSDAAALHEAWLCEVLDLEPARAATGYRRLFEATRPPQNERWLALARLYELRRLGLIEGALPTADDAPAPVRDAIAQSDPPLDVATLLGQAAAASARTQSAGTDSLRLPSLRPSTPAVHEWLSGQSLPSVDERMKQRLQRVLRTRRSDSGRGSEYWIAADILRVELQGHQAMARARRALYFPDWKPPVVDGEPEASLQQVRARLDTWLADTALSSGELALLRELREQMDLRAATDPAAALEFVARLPLYAERLLAKDLPADDTSRRSGESTPTQSDGR